MFFRVVLPVVMVQNTVLICVSSADNEENWYSKIRSLKDDAGNQLLFSANYKNICETCEKLEPSVAALCPHNKSTEAPHKSKSQGRKYDKVFEKMGESEANLMENKGIIGRSGNSVFVKEDVEWVFNPKHAYRESITSVNPRSIPALFMAIDPNGGGRDHAAVMIGYRNYDTASVVVSIHTRAHIHTRVYTRTSSCQCDTLLRTIQKERTDREVDLRAVD